MIQDEWVPWSYACSELTRKTGTIWLKTTTSSVKDGVRITNDVISNGVTTARIYDGTEHPLAQRGKVIINSGGLTALLNKL